MTKPRKPRSDKAALSPGYCRECNEPIDEGQFYHHRRDKSGEWWHCAAGCCPCPDPHRLSDRINTGPAAGAPTHVTGTGGPSSGNAESGSDSGAMSGSSTGGTASGDSQASTGSGGPGGDESSGDGQGQQSSGSSGDGPKVAAEGTDPVNDWDPSELDDIGEGLANGLLDPDDAEAMFENNTPENLEDFFSPAELDQLAKVATGDPAASYESGMDVGQQEPGESGPSEQDIQDMLDSIKEPTGNPAIDNMLDNLGIQSKMQELIDQLNKQKEREVSEAEKRAAENLEAEMQRREAEVLAKAQAEIDKAKEDGIAPVQVILPEEEPELDDDGNPVLDDDGNPVMKKKQGALLNMTHYLFPKVLKLVSMQFNVYLWGPPGGGKSTIVRQVAQALGRRYAYASLSPQTPESRLVGYLDAQGRYIMAALADFWENGGVFCIDELDNISPGLAVLINTMLDSDEASLPHGMVPKHPDFVLVCCGNTPGTGADWLFPGRRKFDAAFRERFMAVPFEYDEKLETAIVDSENTEDVATIWTEWVRRVRQHCKQAQVPLIVSPRAAKNGARCLAQADPLEVHEIVEYAVFKGALDETTVRSVLSRCPVPTEVYDFVEDSRA